ncbi:protein required for attachment to host cells [Breoghania corrubedonensis]|uniref:Protein required for attachment to host cells n=1 Tax=Breoghania corrubedonensis TaxID=665038 RepID=A0A2T5VIB8_9HYPH|nr:host attachment family protein [Breoghania corrubedonensis]PTW63490.1 protein required for attachment to host cells [Breoghania corrubedonensis]
MGGIRIAHNAWVLVGDGEKALFLRNEGEPFAPNLKVIQVLEHENPPNREQATDAPGRQTDALGPHSSSMEYTDWHIIEKERFAKTLAEALYKAVQAKKYRDLVLVAPPPTLGALRKVLHGDVVACISAEIDKTLTGHSVDQIEKNLSEKA